MNARKEQFFQRMEEQELALTFDDVRLVTRRSHVAAPEVDLKSRFTRNVELKVPFISAAMDTVTESEMAIAMAKLGGIGVIHSGLSVKDQAKEVRRVKYHLSGIIEEPITVTPDQSMESVLQMCDRRRFDFRTFPVIDENGRMVGLLSQNDFDFCDDLMLPVGNEMTPFSEVKSAIGGVAVKSAHDAYDIMKNNKKKTLPLVDKERRVAGMYVLSDVLRIVRGNPHQYNLDAKARLRAAIAVPTDPEEAIERIDASLGYVDVALINTAQGDSDFAFDTLKAVKERYDDDIDIAIGNISEGESAKELALNGADGILNGQGPGSICTTRRETGIGMPQVTSTHSSVKGVEESGKDAPVITDGGITEAGDIPIALASGAEAVVMGRGLAGTKETPGEMILDANGQPAKLYRGMGSPSALRDNASSRKRYSTEGTVGKPLAEGVEALIPYRGSVVDVVDLYIKALRRSMSYVGAPDIATLRNEVRLRRITNAGLRESHPHDIQIVNR